MGRWGPPRGASPIINANNRVLDKYLTVLRCYTQMSWQWWRWRTSSHSSLRWTPLGFSDPIGEGDSRAWGPRQCTISLTHRHRTFFNNFSMEELFTLPHTCFLFGTDLTSASHGKHRSPRQQTEVGVFLNRPHYYNKTTTDFFQNSVPLLSPGWIPLFISLPHSQKLVHGTSRFWRQRNAASWTNRR